MYSVQCHFCSRSNPADAKFCSGCLVQLNLTPCPYCDEVNELSALVCHACRGELLQGSVGRVSGRTDPPGIDAARTGIDSRSRVATRSSASGRLVGSTRESPADEEGAVSSYVEHIERSMRQAVVPAPVAHSDRRLRMIGEPERHSAMAGRKHIAPVRPPRRLLSSTRSILRPTPTRNRSSNRIPPCNRPRFCAHGQTCSSHCAVFRRVARKGRNLDRVGRPLRTHRER